MSIKDEFIEEPDRLAKHTRSYKLVFLLMYVELNLKFGKVSLLQLTKFY